jgi:hypothetical protein
MHRSSLTFTGTCLFSEHFCDNLMHCSSSSVSMTMISISGNQSIFIGKDLFNSCNDSFLTINLTYLNFLLDRRKDDRNLWFLGSCRDYLRRFPYVAWRTCLCRILGVVLWLYGLPLEVVTSTLKLSPERRWNSGFATWKDMLENLNLPKLDRTAEIIYYYWL